MIELVITKYRPKRKIVTSNIALIIFFFLFSLSSFGQKDVSDDSVKAVYHSIPRVDGKYEYSGVVTLDSTYKKDILYKNAKLFITNAFKSPKDVIQYDDREEGKVIIKGTSSAIGRQGMFLVSAYDTWRLHFSVEIFCKDGRYRYKMYDMDMVQDRDVVGSETSSYSTKMSLDEAYNLTQSGTTKKMCRKLFAETIDNISSFILGIKSAMSKKVSTSDKDF